MDPNTHFNGLKEQARLDAFNHILFDIFVLNIDGEIDCQSFLSKSCKLICVDTKNINKIVLISRKTQKKHRDCNLIVQ